MEIDIQAVTCANPFPVFWYDRQGRPGFYVFEKFAQYSLDVSQGQRYRLPIPTSNTLRDMTGESDTLQAEAAEVVEVVATFVGKENAKALDAIRFAQVVFLYDKDASEEYLKWRRIFPKNRTNKIPERWDTVNEVNLSFEFDPVYNM